MSVQNSKKLATTNCRQCKDETEMVLFLTREVEKGKTVYYCYVQCNKCLLKDGFKINSPF